MGFEDSMLLERMTRPTNSSNLRNLNYKRKINTGQESLPEVESQIVVFRAYQGALQFLHRQKLHKRGPFRK